MAAGTPQRALAPLRLEAEARELYAVLSDGHDGLGFHVSRGCSLRLAGTGRAVISSEVPAGSWRPARDLRPDGEQVDRRFNPYVLRQHLLGNYDAAIESPSWTSLVTFDIDRHLPGHADEHAVDFRVVGEANRQRDSVLAGLWRAFSLGPSRLPVIQKTPSGGYHVTLPINRGAGEGEHTERTWPAEWLREHICEALWAGGLELRPGVLELFPSGTRLRAPCGRGMLLMRPRNPERSEQLDLEPVPGTWSPRPDRQLGAFRQVRKVAPMVRAYLDQLEATRRPLEAWLGTAEPLWHPVKGPFRARKKRGDFHGVSALSRHIEEVQAAASAGPAGDRVGVGSGWLVYGDAFRDRIRSLTQFGLTETGTRHDAALKLVWYWSVRCGASRGEVERRLRSWLSEHDHASNLRDVSPKQFVDQTVREGLHYFDNHVMPSLAGTVRTRGMDVSLRPLQDRDRAAVVSQVEPAVQNEAAAILGRLRASADASGWVPGQVLLSGAVLEGDCGERRVSVEVDGVVKRRRAAVVARDELARLGVLALHNDYSVGSHGRRYTCWYRFGSGMLPHACAETGARVLARRTVPEGTLELVAARGKEKFPHVRLRAKRAKPASGAGRRWWIRLYTRRRYTPGEFLDADVNRMLRARRVWSPPVAPRFAAVGTTPIERVIAPRDSDPTPRVSMLERAMASALSAWSVANDDRAPP